MIQTNNLPEPETNNTFVHNWFESVDEILNLCISDAIWQMEERLVNQEVVVDNKITEDGHGEIIVDDTVICKYEVNNNIMTKLYAKRRY